MGRRSGGDGLGCLIVLAASVFVTCGAGVSAYLYEKTKEAPLAPVAARPPEAEPETEAARDARIKAEIAAELHASAVRRESERQPYRAMTPAQREKALRDACTGEGCDDKPTKLVIESAATPAEGAKLQLLLTTLKASADARRKARELQEEQQEAQEKARRLLSRVCCCDGSVSPTCTTVHRGCCSHHGGVCACR